MTMFSKPLQPDFMKYQVCSLPETEIVSAVTPKDMTLSVIVSF